MGWGRPSREELLEDAARKPIGSFLQIDGWQEMGFDDFFEPDEDGDVITRSHTWELNRSQHPVRVLIHEGTDYATAVRLLRKAIDSLKETDLSSDRPLMGIPDDLP